MIADSINQKIAEALKAHDELRLSTLRMLSSALNYEFIAKQHKLSEDEELAVVKREAKKRKDAIETFTAAIDKQGFGQDIGAKIDIEKQELEILQEYLPAEMSDEELNQLVIEAISQLEATTPADMGKVIGMVMGKAKGTADGAKVSQIVKSKLIH